MQHSAPQTVANPWGTSGQAVRRPAKAVTMYRVIGVGDVGAVHATVAWLLPAVLSTFVAAPGRATVRHCGRRGHG